MAVAMITSYPILHFCGRAAFFSITGLDTFPLQTPYHERQKKEKIRRYSGKFFELELNQRYRLSSCSVQVHVKLTHFFNWINSSHLCLVSYCTDACRFYPKYYRCYFCHWLTGGLFYFDLSGNYHHTTYRAGPNWLAQEWYGNSTSIPWYSFCRIWYVDFWRNIYSSDNQRYLNYFVPIYMWFLTNALPLYQYKSPDSWKEKCIYLLGYRGRLKKRYNRSWKQALQSFSLVIKLYHFQGFDFFIALDLLLSLQYPAYCRVSDKTHILFRYFFFLIISSAWGMSVKLSLYIGNWLTPTQAQIKLDVAKRFHQILTFTLFLANQIGGMFQEDAHVIIIILERQRTHKRTCWWTQFSRSRTTS